MDSRLHYALLGCFLCLTMAGRARAEASSQDLNGVYDKYFNGAPAAAPKEPESIYPVDDPPPVKAAPRPAQAEAGKLYDANGKYLGTVQKVEMADGQQGFFKKDKRAAIRAADEQEPGALGVPAQRQGGSPPPRSNSAFGFRSGEDR